MKALRSFGASTPLLNLVQVGHETQIIGELGQMHSVIIKTRLPLKIKAGMIRYLLIQVYCYARPGKIVPVQTEVGFLAAFMLCFNLLKPNLFNKTAFCSSQLQSKA